MNCIMNFQFIYLIVELCHAIFCRSCVFHQKYLTMLDKKIPLQFQKINLQLLIIVFGRSEERRVGKEC